MNRSHILRPLIALILLIAAATGAHPQSSQDQILDFEKTKDAPEIYLKIERWTGVYVDFDYHGYLMNLAPDTQVKLLAYHPDQYLIQSTKPACKGWVDATAITPLKPDVIEAYKARLKEDKEFAAAIKKKQILPNMSTRHVIQAIGEPTRKAIKADDAGNSLEIWSYITTEPIYQNVSVPQTVSTLRGPITTMQIIRQKVGERETASLILEFRNARVVALQQSKDQKKTATREIPDQKWKN